LKGCWWSIIIFFVIQLKCHIKGKASALPQWIYLSKISYDNEKKIAVAIRCDTIKNNFADGIKIGIMLQFSPENITIPSFIALQIRYLRLKIALKNEKLIFEVR